MICKYSYKRQTRAPHCTLYSSPRQRTVGTLLCVQTRLPRLLGLNMAEAEQVPRPPPVLAGIPARVQALDGRNPEVNPLPRAPEGEQVQADQAAPANELAQPVEVLVLFWLLVLGSGYVSCSIHLLFHFIVSLGVVCFRCVSIVLGTLWFAGSCVHIASFRLVVSLI